MRSVYQGQMKSTNKSLKVRPLKIVTACLDHHIGITHYIYFASSDFFARKKPFVIAL